MHFSKDELTSLVFFLVMLFYFISSFTIMSPGFLRVVVGPRLVPQAFGIIGMLTSGALFIISYTARKSKKKIEGEGKEMTIDKSSLLMIFSAVSAIFLYGLLLQRIGYIISTIILFLFLSIRLGGEWKRSLIMSIIMSFLVYLLFTRVIGVNLPKGLFYI